MGTIWSTGIVVCWAIIVVYMLTAWISMAVWYAKGNIISANPRDGDFPKTWNMLKVIDDSGSMVFLSILTTVAGYLGALIWPILIPIFILRYLHGRNKERLISMRNE